VILLHGGRYGGEKQELQLAISICFDLPVVNGKRSSSALRQTGNQTRPQRGLGTQPFQRQGIPEMKKNGHEKGLTPGQSLIPDSPESFV
jgi:hypothetical protein